MDADERTIRELLQQGYCCSQVIVMMGLRARYEDNETLVAASSGLCLGMHGGLLCGILSGASLVLSMFDSKNAAQYMIPQLLEWYDDTYGAHLGGMNCSDINKTGMQMDRCGSLLVDVWRHVKELLKEFGFDVQESV